jgi:hypothetical protein
VGAQKQAKDEKPHESSLLVVPRLLFGDRTFVGTGLDLIEQDTS